MAARALKVTRRTFLKVLLGSAILSSSVALLAALNRAARSREPAETVPSGQEPRKDKEVYLPMPRLSGRVSVEEALARRRSVREYLEEPLSVEEISQIMWAAQGVSEIHNGFRTAPSAGGTYPLEVYLVVKTGGVKGLEPGVYKYSPRKHSLRLVRSGDFTRELYEAALEQPWVADAAANIVITAVYRRTTRRYGERGIRYVHMEAGHAGQNVYLQATALGLGSVVIGAFIDERVHELLGRPADEHPLYIIPLGKPRKPYLLSEDELRKFYEENRR